jgi:3-oxoacyl-[acyl-carrier protein] reductase
MTTSSVPSLPRRPLRPTRCPREQRRWPPTGTFEDLDERYWQFAIDQNLLSAIRCAHEALPLLKRSGAGRIINVTSVAVKQPIDGLILSNTTRLVSSVWPRHSPANSRPSASVNNPCPGNIATEHSMALIEERARRAGASLEDVGNRRGRVPMGHLGTPEDVAALAVFLASAQARFISGATIQVDGGATTALM